MKYRNDIQVMRAIAILMVLAYHLRIPGFQKGYLGVDIFFVISGYLMSGLYSNATWKTFYSKRVKKLFPAYLVTLLLTLLYSFQFSVYPDFLQVVRQAIYSILLIPNVYFAQQISYFEPSVFRPLLHFWSLGLEFQFYLIFPLLAKFIKKKRVLYVIAISSFILCLSTLYLMPKLSFYLIPMRLWEFLIGVLAFKSIDVSSGFEKRYSRVKYFFTYLLMLVAVFILPMNGISQDALRGHPGIFTFLISILAAFLIRSGSAIFIQLNTLTRIFKRVGDNSYLIYLTHYPIIVFLAHSSFEFETQKTNTFASISVAIFFIFTFSLALKFLLGVISKIQSPVKNISIIFIICVLLLVFLPNIRMNQLSERETRIYQSLYDRGTFRCGQIRSITYRIEERVKREVSFCKISKSFKSQKILLLGDSHADAIKFELMRLANSKNLNLYLNVQNNLLLTETPTQDQLVQSIVSNDFSGVIIHFSSGAIDPIDIYSFAEKLSAVGVKIVVLGPVPVWKMDVPKMLILGEFSGYVPQSQNYEDYKMANMGYFGGDTTANLADKHFVDTGKYMCNPDCLISTPDLNLFYWDSSHLTLTGASFLNPILDSALRKVT